MVFNKDRIVKIISDKIHENSVKNIKKENKDGLKKTIRKIVAKPKRNIKLSIGGKDTFKDRLNDLKNKFNPNKKKKSEEYIEFK